LVVTANLPEEALGVLAADEKLDRLVVVSVEHGVHEHGGAETDRGGGSGSRRTEDGPSQESSGNWGTPAPVPPGTVLAIPSDGKKAG
jgi:hypothetical protein